MREIRDPQEMLRYSQTAKYRGKKIAFVPTMGALHEGHLSLVQEARKSSDMVVVSIFVNPLQFGPREDFARYPRDLKKDKNLLKDLGIDVLFLPDASAIYPPGFITRIEVGKLSNVLCGISRPGHFSGVATIVAKLLNIVLPDRAFFGEKDFQQLLIIRQMVRDLNLPVEIVSCPTVREFDGLAMSSRNAYLDPKARGTAPVLYRALCRAKEEIKAGETAPGKIISRMRFLISSQPKIKIDYLAVVDPETLDPVKKVSGRVLLALAVYIGKTRLIDNLLVKTG